MLKLISSVNKSYTNRQSSRNINRLRNSVEDFDIEYIEVKFKLL